MVSGKGKRLAPYLNLLYRASACLVPRLVPQTPTPCLPSCLPPAALGRYCEISPLVHLAYSDLRLLGLSLFICLFDGFIYVRLSHSIVSLFISSLAELIAADCSFLCLLAYKRPLLALRDRDIFMRFITIQLTLLATLSIDQRLLSVYITYIRRRFAANSMDTLDTLDTLTRLNKDIALLIFDLLPPSDIVACSRVTKKWRHYTLAWIEITGFRLHCCPNLIPREQVDRRQYYLRYGMSTVLSYDALLDADHPQLDEIRISCWANRHPVGRYATWLESTDDDGDFGYDEIHWLILPSLPTQSDNGNVYKDCGTRIAFDGQKYTLDPGSLNAEGYLFAGFGEGEYVPSLVVSSIYLIHWHF